MTENAYPKHSLQPNFNDIIFFSTYQLRRLNSQLEVSIQTLKIEQKLSKINDVMFVFLYADDIVCMFHE